MKSLQIIINPFKIVSLARTDDEGLVRARLPMRLVNKTTDSDTVNEIIR